MGRHLQQSRKTQHENNCINLLLICHLDRPKSFIQWAQSISTLNYNPGTSRAFKEFGRPAINRYLVGITWRRRCQSRTRAIWKFWKILVSLQSAKFCIYWWCSGNMTFDMLAHVYRNCLMKKRENLKNLFLMMEVDKQEMIFSKSIILWMRFIATWMTWPINTKISVQSLKLEILMRRDQFMLWKLKERILKLQLLLMGIIVLFLFNFLD